MVSPANDLLVDRLDGPRWELALDLLYSGDGAVSLNGLVLSTDAATATSSRRLHVEFECPFDPSLVGKAPHERLRSQADDDLSSARATIEKACSEDERFSALVAGSGLVYEFVHRYGMGSLLVATAGRTGDLFVAVTIRICRDECAPIPKVGSLARRRLDTRDMLR